MLTRPNFRNEYGCLSKDLAVVDFWLKWQEMEETLKALQEEKDSLTSHGTATDAAYQRIVKGIRSRLNGLPVKEEAQAEQLGIIGMRMAEKLSSPLAAVRDFSDDIETVLKTYTTFDEERFKSHWTVLFSPVDAAALAKVNGAIGGITKKLNTHLENVCSVFQDQRVPKNWRGIVAPQDNKDAQRDLALTIVNHFVRDWTARARQFLVPVTIMGVEIRLLPPELRRVWHTAYTKLGLEDVPKKAIYVAVQPPSHVMSSPQSMSAFIGS